MLAQLGCEEGQGYLFAKPMPAEDFRSYSVPWQKVVSGDTTISQPQALSA